VCVCVWEWDAEPRRYIFKSRWPRQSSIVLIVARRWELPLSRASVGWGWCVCAREHWVQRTREWCEVPNSYNVYRYIYIYIYIYTDIIRRYITLCAHLSTLIFYPSATTRHHMCVYNICLRAPVRLCVCVYAL